MALHAVLVLAAAYAGDGISRRLEIHANPYPMYPVAERLNYVSSDTAGGRPFTVNLGPTRVNASILWKCVDYQTAKGYEDFLLKGTKLGLHPFAIECPGYIDFGLGKGIGISSAYYSGPSNLGGIIKANGINGLYYDIELPYMFVRDA